MRTPKAVGRIAATLISLLPLAAALFALGFTAGWHPTISAIAVASIAVVLCITLSVLCIIWLCKPNQAFVRRHLPAAFFVASLAGLAPACCRALLPWEEPLTGDGSPLAVLIGIAMLAAFGFVFVTTPTVFVGLRVRHSLRSAGQG